MTDTTTCPLCGGTGTLRAEDPRAEDDVERILRAHPLPATDGYDETLAWYRETFDDDECPDDMAVTRVMAWLQGRSLGPIRHGVPLRTS